jgi:hypothetical protein
VSISVFELADAFAQVIGLKSERLLSKGRIAATDEYESYVSRKPWYPRGNAKSFDHNVKSAPKAHE